MGGEKVDGYILSRFGAATAAAAVIDPGCNFLDSRERESEFEQKREAVCMVENGNYVGRERAFAFLPSPSSSSFSSTAAAVARGVRLDRLSPGVGPFGRRGTHAIAEMATTERAGERVCRRRQRIKPKILSRQAETMSTREPV